MLVCAAETLWTHLILCTHISLIACGSGVKEPYSLYSDLVLYRIEADFFAKAYNLSLYLLKTYFFSLPPPFHENVLSWFLISINFCMI